MPTVTLAPATTSMLNLSLIDLPKDARPHDPAALDVLAHDMRNQGQLQEIIVEAKGSRYSVIAGVGRTLAARKLGWKEIRASVREGVSEFDRARITFAENENRENADAFYQAYQLTRMITVMKCSQQALANELGISEATVNAYLAVERMPAEVKKLRRLSLGQLTQIARLNNADSKIELARTCAKKDLSVRQVKALVNRTLRARVTAKKKRSLALPDPLGKVWETVQKRLSPGVYWEAKYGVHRIEDKHTLNGWFFFVSPMAEDSTKPDLARWFKEMGAALAGDKFKDTSLDVFKETKRVDRALVKTLGPRLPKNKTEEAELQKIAVMKGPKAVYAWIYGADSFMTKAVPASTWKEMGMTATEGLRRVLDGIRQFQKM